MDYNKPTYRHHQPQLTVIEGGNEPKDPRLLADIIPHAVKRKTAVILGSLGLLAGGAAIAQQGLPEKVVSCTQETQLLGASPTKSHALVEQLPGIDGNTWEHIAAVPVTTPNGEVLPFGSFGPQGPPEGSHIPINCWPN